MAEERFEYTYSSARNSEILRIRQKYLPQQPTKLDQLRELDRSATRRGTAVSLVRGTIYSLLLGLGMSCTMVWGGAVYVPGIVIGCVGIAGIASGYPVYNRIVRYDRQKLAPEILRLSEELILGNE